MNLFETVKDTVSARQVADYYGLHVGHNGMCNCIFHNDRNPSMKVDERYFCFGCGATGDAISLTAQLFGLGQKDAAIKLATDFGINIDAPRRVSVSRPATRLKTATELLQEWTDAATATLGAYRLQLLEWAQSYAPKTMDDALDSRYSEMLLQLPKVNYLLEELLIASPERQAELQQDYGEAIEKYQKRLIEITPSTKTVKEETAIAEPKKTNQERLKEITDSIETGIQELFQSDKYRDYLRTMSRFHNYSVNNTILIYMQRPDATLVAGFNKWKNQFQRTVNKGEHGIKIIAPTPYKKTISRDRTDPKTGEILLGRDGQPLTEDVQITVPMFKPVTVFDISQTSGKPLPQLVSDLSGNVENYELFMEALKRSSPVPITIRPIESNADGFFSPGDQSITIREGMSEIQTVCATIHEIGHSKLHNYAKAKEQGEEILEKDRRTEEVEAESIAFTVCAYYGIETAENSLGYIAGWSKDKTLPELKSSLETISKTASELISDINQNCSEIRKERGLDQQHDTNRAALYLLDNSLYLHIQETTAGYDFTLFDHTTMKQIDSGQLVSENPAAPAEHDLDAVAQSVLSQQGLSPKRLEEASLDILAVLRDANLQQTSSADARVVEQAYPMPDSRLSKEAMEKYGYTDESMLPLSRSRAMELYENGASVYLLFDNSTKALAMVEEDIAMHSGIFGITREDWTAIHEADVRAEAQAKKERSFLESPREQYAVYQLRDDPACADIRFMNSDWLSQNGMDVARSNYELVYVGSLPQGANTDAQLEAIFEELNMHRPADFTGHSLSVSDVVAIRTTSSVSCHFCDSIGFKELPEFIPPENYLKNAEITLEDAYDLGDGILNNGQKDAVADPVRPRAEASKEKPATPEQPGKKPSVLNKLRTIKPKETVSADGQKRSIEYEEIQL